MTSLTSFTAFLRRPRSEYADEPELVRFRVPAHYLAVEAGYDPRDPHSRGGPLCGFLRAQDAGAPAARGTAPHFAKLVTRVRPGAAFARDFLGDYVDRGSITQAPAGSVLLIVDALVSPDGFQYGAMVEAYTITDEQADVELDEDRTAQDIERAQETMLTEPLRREFGPLQTGNDWGRYVAAQVTDLLGDERTASERERARLERVYGPNGVLVGALADALRDLGEIEWQDLAREAERDDTDTVIAAGHRARVLASGLGRERPYRAATDGIWREAEYRAKRAVGFDALHGRADAEEGMERAHARLFCLRLAVQAAAAAAAVGDELDEQTYETLNAPFIRLSELALSA